MDQIEMTETPMNLRGGEDMEGLPRFDIWALENWKLFRISRFGFRILFEMSLAPLRILYERFSRCPGLGTQVIFDS